MFYQFVSSKPSSLAWAETGFSDHKRALKILEFLKENLGITVCAQIFTAGIIMIQFNTFTWYSFLANLCLLWLVPILFILGVLVIPIGLIMAYTPMKNVFEFINGLILFPPAELFIRFVEVLGIFAPPPITTSWMNDTTLISWWSIGVIAWVLLSMKAHKGMNG